MAVSPPTAQENTADSRGTDLDVPLRPLEKGDRILDILARHICVLLQSLLLRR